MSIAPIPTTGAPPASSTSSDAMKQLSGNFDTFLTMLTTQLKNQDPTSPMDSNQFTQQLVQFSQVEQQIDTNTNLTALIAQGKAQAGTLATAYLGKNVSVTDGTASLSDGAANWTYHLNTPATAAALTVTDANNKVVYVGLGQNSEGDHTFAWDGKDNNGNAVADGTYKLSVTAKDSAGNDVTSEISSSGTVTGVDTSSDTPQLIIGNMKTPIANVSTVGT
jgi:flagellar basal-body rod modification protein FlgD